MNKTLSIGLAGFSFTIEEHAYIKLSDYLAALRNTLDANEADEVMHDIEIRMVEIFKETLGKREVINDDDVEKVIAQIGAPEQIEEQEKAYYSEQTSSTKKEERTSAFSGQKQLFRDPENGKIGGVCAGLANYFGIDPVWIRLLLIFFVIMKGFGILLYVILWIVLPQAKTASDYLKMKGKPINFDNLKEESGKIVHFANESSQKLGQAFQSQKGNIDNVGHVLLSIVRIFFAIFFGILGISCLLGSFAFFGISFGSDAVNVPEGISFFLGNDMPNFLLITILVLTLLIPAIIFMLISIKLFAPNSKLRYTGYVIGALVFLWFGLLLIGGFTATKMFTKYSGDNDETQNIAINTTSDSILVDVKKVEIPANYKSYFGDYFSDGKMIYQEDYPYIEVKHQNVDQPYLIVKREARGYNQPIQLKVPVEIRDNKILLPNYFIYSYRDRMRHYNANYQLIVPKNFKVIKLGDRINFDDDMNKDEDDNDNSDDADNSANININGTSINIPSNDSDSIIINGKKVGKDEAESYVKKVILNPKNINGVNIDVNSDDKNNKIIIKTK
ncbi:PspC domain-containing protein [Halpernia frigidisoli]|uniref:Phage shock protein C (PspC) family protein n=1 Tax=Halpernia frigidisoli TaxID=1125876 RepID=A0A1I3FHH7_9FLAO|nr:PspC domain-containing protein [Halpernia frigidisoli]SFI10673.1 phage shock protein C (PspC) family protein [Halpernia frigidisoli]